MTQLIPVFLKIVGAIMATKLVIDVLSEDEDEKMYDNHADILAFHNDEVTLGQPEQDEMRNRRDTNRKKLKDGLYRDEQPAPIGCHTQGSYAHRTMVQDAGKDYDIDDGVYFKKKDLIGPKGGDKTARDAKEMVRAAVHDDKFSRPPEVRTNCVRVYYNAGYHVDLPVYREVKTEDAFGNEQVSYELASTDWKSSDPRSVTTWFKDQNKQKSPGGNNGGQLRRNVRLNKAFARSRDSWRSTIASGFTITTLIADECYHSDAGREDVSLYNTFVAMRDRLNWNLEVTHPTLKEEKLTKGPDDPSTRFLREKLDWAIDKLQVLFDPDCTAAQAAKAWDAVFNTDFFSNRIGSKTEESQAEFDRAPAILAISSDEKMRRAEAAARVVEEQGPQSKPWACFQ